MQRVNIPQKELEAFFDRFGNGKQKYNKKYKIRLLSFLDFKKSFCNDILGFSKDKNEKKYKSVYENISWGDSLIYKEIREFIIGKFTEKIKFCPYCGKAPFIYFDENNGKKRMFQFDHFFPKNAYNSGIINFYNLIPSCNACNHLKHEDNPLDIILDGGVIFHPYFGNLYLDEDKILKRDYAQNADIRLNYISKNSKFWKLGKKYLNSQDTFNTFDFIQDKRTKMKAERMKFKESTKTDDQFGTAPPLVEYKKKRV